MGSPFANVVSRFLCLIRHCEVSYVFHGNYVRILWVASVAAGCNDQYQLHLHSSLLPLSVLLYLSVFSGSHR